MKDTAVKQRFVELRASGHSYAVIADELHVSKNTLIAWSRDFKVEIANLKATELDALHRRYKLHIEARIEMFGTILDRLKNEFAKRDLSAIPTDRLIDQMGKVSSILAADIKPPCFLPNEADKFAYDHDDPWNA